MIGAIVGDIVGSRFEWHNVKTFGPLFSYNCSFTDDSIMTIAVADALMKVGDSPDLAKQCVSSMLTLGRPYPTSGYGGRFLTWMYNSGDDPKPYNSYGNGAAMRISPVGWFAKSKDEVKRLSEIVTSVSHNHPKAIKGAEAVAMSIFKLRTGMSRPGLKAYIMKNYYKDIPTLDSLYKNYKFTEEIEETVKPAFTCLFESRSFEEAIRLAISIGGDSDTIACIVGSMAEALYGVPKHIQEQAKGFLDDRLLPILEEFEKRYTIGALNKNTQL